MRLEMAGSGAWQAGQSGDLELSFLPSSPFKAGSRFWLFHDIRQDASLMQSDEPLKPGFIESKDNNGDSLRCNAVSLRTLDLYPEVPEFLRVAEFHPGNQKTESFRIFLRNWQGPARPINPFRFWVLADDKGEWELSRTGYKSYAVFTNISGNRVPFDLLKSCLASASLRVEGAYRQIPAVNKRKTPGIFWGELHGMAFNQRPLDDFYNYAKHVTGLDFAAAMLFSYNTCVGDVWQDVKNASARHTERGEFIAVTGFECGTPYDDSHRCAWFPDPRAVPPIFCDSRPPARDSHLQSRFHPDTRMCESLHQFYDVIEGFGGIVGGHFHTKTYCCELLAEIWQKQQPMIDEEQRLLTLLKQGMRFGIVGGSDTHDSMPGNPDPEPACPRPAGLTGVYADELTPAALFDAFRARRVFATSGARIAVDFHCGAFPMGSVLSSSLPRNFTINVDAPGELVSVELLRNGETIRAWNPCLREFHAKYADLPDKSCNDAFYLVRAIQNDGHKAWSSPIWLLEKAT